MVRAIFIISVNNVMFLYLLVLEKSAVECTKEVNKQCDMMITMTENKREELLNNITERKSKMRMQLDEALIQIKSANDISLQLEDKCKEIAAKSDITFYQRT